ncbi:glycosyltransferase [Brachybacterium sp. GPGPB12]|uniref:glycosyltransferase family 2 protein n=1 Tax=Brachybacterium sp. GPGPB12 TaxID=3023517 RepID=UPI0031345611
MVSTTARWRRSRTSPGSTCASIVFPENRGRVAALNAGFEVARGDVLIRCDDDLLPAVDYVAAHVSAHQDGPGGVIGLYLNEYSTTPYAEVYGKDADQRFRRDAYNSASAVTWRYWAGNCSITREIWEAVGPYDSEYRLYGWEDVDYGYRIHAAGFEVHLAPELETPHRVAAVTTAVRSRRASHSGARAGCSNGSTRSQAYRTRFPSGACGTRWSVDCPESR